MADQDQNNWCRNAVPVYRLAGSDKMVYCTWGGGCPRVNGVLYSIFEGWMSIDEARAMGAVAH